jgi:hypothetical protein
MPVDTFFSKTFSTFSYLARNVDGEKDEAEELEEDERLQQRWALYVRTQNRHHFRFARQAQLRSVW